MRKGFSYIQAIIACTLGLFILACSLLILQSTLRLLRQPPQLVAPLLDTVGTDIQYALSVQTDGTGISVTTADDAYRYCVINNRLARIRDGLLYLSPATPGITVFAVTTSDNRLYRVTLATATETHTRVFRRRN